MLQVQKAFCVGAKCDCDAGRWILHGGFSIIHRPEIICKMLQSLKEPKLRQIVAGDA